jgi:L-fucose mutarotase
MLKGISPLLSPELLQNLAMMGHGDEIVLADAHFPGHALNPNVLRADGIRIADLLKAILPLVEPDAYVENPLLMMKPVDGDHADPEVEDSYLSSVQITHPQIKSFGKLERFAFYERARNAFAILMTGETAKYGNVILKKGVTPVL